MKTGIELIAAERQRQIEQEGWTPEHDDGHDFAELACAATCYALESASHVRPTDIIEKIVQTVWPFDAAWWKPSDDPVRNLTKAGALIAAEIDRLQRLSAPKD